MGAVDRLRSAIAHLRLSSPYHGVHTPVASRSTIMVDVDDAEALCDLHHQARKIESLLYALIFPLREEWPLTSKAVEQHRDNLGEILSRLEDREEGGKLMASPPSPPPPSPQPDALEYYQHVPHHFERGATSLCRWCGRPECTPLHLD